METKRAYQRVLATAFRPFTVVKPAETVTVAIMTFAAFLLLTAYYLLKTVREPLILLQGGADVKLYARAGQALIMVGVVYAYGELARRFGRMRLLTLVFAFFISNLVVFTLLARTQLHIGLSFFLWVGVFSYTVVAQFWAVAADIYTAEQGKRLFPIIGAGSSIGAVVGSGVSRLLIPLGPSMLMGTAVVVLTACVLLIVWVEHRALADGPAQDPKQAEAPLSAEGAFHLMARDNYLLVIAGLVVCLNWVNSSGEYLLDRALLLASSDVVHNGQSAEVFIGAFKADYFAWYNGIGLLLQLFAVSRILRIIGVANALYLLPAFAFFAYTAAALFPVLAVLRVVKIGENSLQYSVQDTTRHALFLVSSRVEKFVGKTAVDTVAVRLGAIFASIVVMLGTAGGWSIATFAWVNVGLSATWIAFAIAIGKDYKRRSAMDEAGLANEPLSANR